MPKERSRELKVSPAFVTKILDAEKGIVEAVVNVYGILDLGDDISVNGMCAKTIAERGRSFKVLNSHNTGSVLNVVGMCLSAREIGRDELPKEILVDWPEATGGLLTETQYLLDTPEGKGTFDRIKVGAVTEFSIGYEAIQVEYKKTEWRGQVVNARYLKEIRLWEYSPVVFGMNPATAVTGVKTDEKDTAKMEQKQNGRQPATVADYLCAKMRSACNKEADYDLMCGNMTAVEHKSISDALHKGMDEFVKALPETLAQCPKINGGFQWFDMWAADDPEGKMRHAKSVAQKAGRMLSAANASAIQAALNQIESGVELLEELLSSAGVVDPASDEPEDAPDAEDMSKSKPQAGPDNAPPTDETRKRLLAEILTDLSEFEVDNGSHSGSSGAGNGAAGAG